jgi:GTPase SAR1 family protein
VTHFCPSTPIILCGLKSDLRDKRSCIELLKTQGLTPVTTAQGLSVAKKMKAMYMECSSKEQKGVHEIFDRAIDIAVRGSEDVVGELLNGGGGDGAKDVVGGMPAKRRKRSNCKIL